MKWVNLHEDESTVRTFVKETMANEQLSQTTLITKKILIVVRNLNKIKLIRIWARTVFHHEF
jgi:hypothetical protein